MSHGGDHSPNRSSCSFNSIPSAPDHLSQGIRDFRFREWVRNQSVLLGPRHVLRKFWVGCFIGLFPAWKVISKDDCGPLTISWLAFHPFWLTGLPHSRVGRGLKTC